MPLEERDDDFNLDDHMRAQFNAPDRTFTDYEQLAAVATTQLLESAAEVKHPIFSNRDFELMAIDVCEQITGGKERMPFMSGSSNGASAIEKALATQGYLCLYEGTGPLISNDCARIDGCSSNEVIKTWYQGVFAQNPEGSLQPVQQGGILYPELLQVITDAMQADRYVNVDGVRISKIVEFCKDMQAITHPGQTVRLSVEQMEAQIGKEQPPSFDAGIIPEYRELAYHISQDLRLIGPAEKAQ